MLLWSSLKSIIARPPRVCVSRSEQLHLQPAALLPVPFLSSLLWISSGQEVSSWQLFDICVAVGQRGNEKLPVCLQDSLTVVVEDLRLCSVKPCEDIERRFCFEVVSPTKWDFIIGTIVGLCHSDMFTVQLVSSSDLKIKCPVQIPFLVIFIKTWCVLQNFTKKCYRTR